jgi:chemotaxis protein MotA
MDISSIVGFGIAVAVIGWLAVSGGDARALVDLHAGVCVFGGAMAATMVRFPLASTLHGFPVGLKYTFTMRKVSTRALIDEIGGLADIVRKKGPLALENAPVSDPFLAKGVRYIADGYDADFIRDSLERERDLLLVRLSEGEKIFRSIADCAPAFGMVGTLIGMVQMFANMADPSTLGPYMAIALCATLYGAVVQNFIGMPIADKLHLKFAEEDLNQTLIIDGILQIRDAKSPALVREMLQAYLPEKHRDREDAELEEAA